MKNLLLIAFLFFSSVAFGQKISSLKLVIKNLDHDEGRLRAGLFSSSDLWLDKAVADADTIIYSREEIVLMFDSIPEGDYAISIYHDLDNDGALDTNVIGIPTEPYAFSNNATGMFGPAKFEDAVFAISGDETVHIIHLN